jgi:hypothetical protein
MKALKKGLLLLSTIGSLQASAQLQKTADTTKAQIGDTLKSKGMHDDIKVAELGMIPIEDMDDEDTWFPLGTVVLEDTTREGIMRQLSDKYMKLYKTEQIPLSLSVFDSLDSLIKTGTLKKWVRVGFHTTNGAITSCYIYKESTMNNLLKYEEENK